MSTARQAITLRIDRHLKELAAQAAAANHRSLNGLIEALLDEHCRRLSRSEDREAA
jgi:hypothetical protein